MRCSTADLADSRFLQEAGVRLGATFASRAGLIVWLALATTQADAQIFQNPRLLQLQHHDWPISDERGYRQS